ncbi:hypothetical protein DNU06_08370 [Putridiphycobacter roseus]|uniref:Uncharacterized protein n=1 Tax=Putridiphycobacter roseus TaxID=2219161 RepID=A0A2W1NRJ0_9FLAO|nr:LemA family protein [Putridiphycobacter roseus]PZE17278.1 hypothetical protein DNU06_08370 [Putridiphycobacter roseus]
MDFKEEKYQAQLRAIVNATEASGDRPLSLSELKELANSMGLSDKEWEQLLEEGNRLLALAKNHLKARNYTDAVTAADEATAINPYLKDGNAVLAQAYLMQWLDDQDLVKMQKAEYYARKELKVDAHDTQALNVLSTVQNKKRILGKDGKLKKYLFIGLGVISLLILISYFSISGNSSKGTAFKLIELEEEVNAKYELIQTATERRNNLVPELLKAVQSNDNNRAIINEIENLQKQISSANATEIIPLEMALEKKINEAKGLVSTNDSKSSLIISIEGAENRISFARSAYNEAVKNYNVLVKQNQADFPQFETKPYYP